MFENFIRHERRDIYHLMCSIFAYDRKKPSYEDESINIGDKLKPKNSAS